MSTIPRGLAPLTSSVDGFPAGQLGWVHDLRSVADGTPEGAVKLAQIAKLIGVLVKYSDGPSTTSPNGQPWSKDYASIAAACMAAGLACIPWAYCYPGDEGRGVPALLAQAQRDWIAAGLPGTPLVVIDVEGEWEGSHRDDARSFVQALAAAGVRYAYTSFGWVDQHPTFPWTEFQAGAVAFIPQVYPAGILTEALTVDLVDMVWNRAYGGPSYGGPNPGAGPAGFHALTPQKPVVPAYDTSAIYTTSRLAANWGAPTVSVWLLDVIGSAAVRALAASPYARTTAPPQGNGGHGTTKQPEPTGGGQATYTVPVKVDPNEGGIIVAATFGGPKGSTPYSTIIDTGDELGPTFPQQVANDLGLPHLGDLTVSGATGTGAAYWTECDVTVGDHTWTGVRGAVDPEYQGKPLLGLPFFLSVGRRLEFDLAGGTMTFGG